MLSSICLKQCINRNNPLSLKMAFLSFFFKQKNIVSVQDLQLRSLPPLSPRAAPCHASRIPCWGGQRWSQVALRLAWCRGTQWPSFQCSDSMLHTKQGFCLPIWETAVLKLYPPSLGTGLINQWKNGSKRKKKISFSLTIPNSPRIPTVLFDFLLFGAP